MCVIVLLQSCLRSRQMRRNTTMSVSSYDTHYRSNKLSCNNFSWAIQFYEEKLYEVKELYYKPFNILSTLDSGIYYLDICIRG